MKIPAGIMLRGLDRLLPAGNDEILGLEVATVTSDTAPVTVHKLADPPGNDIQILTWWVKPVLGQRVWLLSTKSQRIIAGVHGGLVIPEPEPPVEMPGAHIRKTGDQSFGTSTWTKITFQATVYADVAGMVDLANSRLVIPATGRYSFGGNLSHPNTYSASHARQVCIVRGDAAPTAGNQLARHGGTNPGDTDRSYWYANLAGQHNFTAGEYVTLWFRNTAASTLGNATDAVTELWAQRVK